MPRPEARDFAPARRRMVERQLAARGIDDPRVLAAMGRVPRDAFVPPDLAEFAYEDGPLPIGEGQTISQPWIVAVMAQAARIAPDARLLEVGAGSGYAAAVLSLLAEEVFAIERHPALAAEARERLGRLGHDNVTVLAADGSGGLPEHAPFDAILVAAGGDRVPEPLKNQLAIGGRLVVPVGGADQQVLLCITRIGPEDWQEDDLGAVRFVPLLGTHGRGSADAAPGDRRSDA